MNLEKPLETKKPIDLYVDSCWDKLDNYISDVLSGKILTCKWTKQAIHRYINDIKSEKYDYNIDSVSKVFKFFYFLRIKNTENQFPRAVLAPYQVFIIANIFGFYKKGTDKRRFTKSFIFLGRKNGKSTFSAALSLYALMADGEANSQVLIAANNNRQAQNDFEYARSIILNSPELNKRIKCIVNKIKYKDNRVGDIKIISPNAEQNDSFSPSFAIIDEVHVAKTHDQIQVIQSGTGARKNPHIMIITTAGFSLANVAYDYSELAKKILDPDNELTDESTFYILFTLDEEDYDKIQDTKLWDKANPCRYDLMTPNYLEEQFAETKTIKTQWTNFLTKHLNIFTTQQEEWLNLSALKTLFVDTIDPSILSKCERFTGVDLSRRDDLSNVSDVYYQRKTETEDEHYYVISKFFKAFSEEKRFRKNGIDLTKWINQGWITEGKSLYIDTDEIANYVLAENNKHKIRSLYYDSFGSKEFIHSLQINSAIYCLTFAQRTEKFDAPLKKIQELISLKKITFTNPALFWNFTNSVVFRDGNGNIKIMKNKSLDAVDGAVACAMALGACIDFINPTIKESSK